MFILIVSGRMCSITIVTDPFREYMAIPKWGIHFRQQKGGGNLSVMTGPILGNSEKMNDSHI